MFDFDNGVGLNQNRLDDLTNSEIQQPASEIVDHGRDNSYIAPKNNDSLIDPVNLDKPYSNLDQSPLKNI